MNVFVDIETIPEQPEDKAKARITETISAPATMSKAETIDDWHSGSGKYAGVKEAAIEKAYRDTSFDGAKGEVASVSWAVGELPVRVEYRTIGGDERGLLKTFFNDILSSHSTTKPYFIGHNAGEFDLKFLYHRAVILGVKPGFSLSQDGRHGSSFFDTMVAWAGYRNRISQDNLCKALGIPGKPDDIDGSKVWDFVKAGKVARVAEYNKDDVEKVRKIYKRLTFSA